ncbi:MAG: hypothetical protein GX456_11835 [Verrucomicrobia bacterium]|nr:hypothetical protein [Verrucomicrobiota bacterium]
MYSKLLAMSMDIGLQKHYAMLLGIGSPWEVKAVALSLQDKKVQIELGWQWGRRPIAGNAGGLVRSTIERRNGRGGTRTRCSSGR